jgi:hypothetical protein
MASLNRTSLDRPGNIEMKIELLVFDQAALPACSRQLVWANSLQLYSALCGAESFDGRTNSNGLPKQVCG